MVLLFHPHLAGMNWAAVTRQTLDTVVAVTGAVGFLLEHHPLYGYKSLQSLLGSIYLSANACCKLVSLTFQS